MALLPLQARAAKSLAEVQKNLRAIEIALSRDDIDILKQRYREQAVQRPGDVELQLYLAWCAGMTDDGWNALKGIATIHPENPWARLGMGRIYLRWNMRDQGLAELEAALRIDKQFHPALVALGDDARLAGDHTLAQARYREALAIQDDAEARAGLGLSLLAQGKSDEARQELERAVALWPEQIEVLSALAQLARARGDARGAEQHLARLSALAPRDREARRTLADLRLEQGQKGAAAADYEAFIGLGGIDAQVLHRLVGLYRELGKPEGEERALRRLSELERGSAEHPLRLAALAEARGAHKEAEVQLVEATERDPKRSDAWLALGRVRVKQDKLREALDAFRTAAEGGSAEAVSEGDELRKRFRLPSRPAKGSVEKIHATISANLNRFYGELLPAHPGLAGTLKLKARVDKTGKVLGVELVEDTLKQPLLAGHAYFALKDAQYPHQKREPLFEFVLEPPRGRKER